MMGGIGFGLGLGLDRDNPRGNLGGSPPFTLESLGLALDLRTPNSAFANDLEANSSGLIGFRSAVTLGGLDDVNVIIDQSQGLAEGTLLASHEFSTDSDGVTNAQGTTVLGAQTVGGFSDCLTVTCDTSTGYHEIELVSLSNNYRKVLKVEFDIYLHSSGAITGGYYKTNGGGGISTLFGISFYNGLPLDTWTTVTVYGYNNGSGGNTIGFHNGSAASFTGTTNDKVSFRNIRVVEVLGNHFVQHTAAAMPHWDNVNFVLDFDGIDDALTTLSSSLATTFQSYADGMISWKALDEETADYARVMITTNAGINEYALLGRNNTGDRDVVAFIRASAVNYTETFDSVAANDMESITIWKDGSSFKSYRDGVELTYLSSPLGAWLNSHTLTDRVIIGAISTFFSAMQFKYLNAKDSATQEQVDNLQQWLIDN